MTLKKMAGPGFTATARLTSITLDGIAVGFRNASLYIDEEGVLKHWHIDMTDVPPSFSVGVYRAVLVDEDGTEYRGRVRPREIPRGKKDDVRLNGTGPLEGWPDA